MVTPNWWAAFDTLLRLVLAAPTGIDDDNNRFHGDVGSHSDHFDLGALSYCTFPATLPSQAPLSPVQPWCIGQTFCPGAVLRTAGITQLYSDAKKFVDKPTNKSAQQVLTNFATLNLPTVTEGDLVNFVENDFLGVAFLSNATDPLLNAFAQIVNGYWTQVARSTNQSALCDDYTNGTCESTLIPLDHTFIIPGGRFREHYYWDSYWIMQGLLKSELYSTVNVTLQNFIDEIDDFGYIPNGGRSYYFDHFQPP
ncbi:Six-hairpin glycosidase-like protein [Pisolithus albus]|nr:Six-hairpin glycosidase-like protein [Pisolithus albus]